jgi:hypothetical protein
MQTEAPGKCSTNFGESERIRRLTLTKGGLRVGGLITGRAEDYGN